LHWGIENSNHCVRDVSLREDFSRIRKNPEIMATLRSFGLNLMHVNREMNIGRAVYRNSADVEKMKRLLGYEWILKQMEGVSWWKDKDGVDVSIPDALAMTFV
jgi:hypothetical protein